MVVTLRFIGLYGSDLMLEVFSVLFDDVGGELIAPTQLFGCPQYQLIKTNEQVGILREYLPQILFQLLILNLVIK